MVLLRVKCASERNELLENFNVQSQSMVIIRRKISFDLFILSNLLISKQIRFSDNIDPLLSNVCAAKHFLFKTRDFFQMSQIEKKNQGTLWKLFKEEVDESVMTKLINLTTFSSFKI